jgi:hypothetical protein
MKGKPKKRERLTPEQLDANYKKYMKGKELNPKGLELFNKTLKKAATTKRHGLK